MSRPGGRSERSWFWIEGKVVWIIWGDRDNSSNPGGGEVVVVWFISGEVNLDDVDCLLSFKICCYYIW